MRRLWILLTLCGVLLALGLLALPTYAGTNFAYGGNEWDGAGYISDNSVQIDKIIFKSKNGVVPSTYQGKPVTSLSAGAVQNSEILESIVIPKSVRSIGAGVFAGCPNLEKITVEAGNPVYHSENNCIIETATNTVVAGCYSSKLPDSVTFIGAGAFRGCKKLVSLSLPNGLRSIGVGAFEGCDLLQAMAIPAETRSVGVGAFAGCTQLKTLTVDAESGYYYSENNCLIEQGSDLLVAVANGFRIPDSVKGIGESAFRGNTLKQIVLPDSVESIGQNAFSDCTALERVEIGSNMTELGTGAFSGCTALSVITVNANNPTYRAEGNCLIYKAEKKIVLGCKGSKIPSGADVKIIGQNAFNGCVGLTFVTLSDTIETVEWGAFRDCADLKQVHFGSGAKKISEMGFLGCALAQITVDPANATYKGQGNCLIHKADGVLVLGCAGSVIPTDGSVKAIGADAFYGCEALTEITIPASVKTVGAYAFGECRNLKRVIIDSEDVSAAMTNRDACGGLSQYAEEILVPISFTFVGSEVVDRRPCAVAVKVGSTAYASYRREHSQESVRKMSDEYHWYACADCGESREEYGMGLHEYAFDCADTCEVCSYKRDADCSYEGEWYWDEDDHWKYCLYCNQIGHQGEHIPGPEATDETPQVCTVCDYVLHAALDHEHNPGYEWKGDDRQHWLECRICQMKMAVSEHILPEGADPTVENTCTLCGETVAPNLQHTHTPVGGYDNDENSHWRYCSECGEEAEKTAHRFGEGVLTLAPTASREGERTYVCADCNFIKIETIPRLEQEGEEDEEDEDGENTPPLITRPMGGTQEPSDTPPDSEPSTQSEGDGLPLVLIGASGAVIVIAAVTLLVLKKKKK